MRKMCLVLGGILLAAVNCAYAFDDGDFQVWNTDVEEFNVNKDSKVVFEQEFRWGDNADQFFYHHYDAGFFKKLKKNFNLGGGYRQVYELKKGKFVSEEEPYLSASLFWDILGANFEDRSRLEYRHFSFQADAGRYRNKITMGLPWKLTRLKIQPFLSDEGLFSLGGTNMFNQNRFYAGLSAGLIKNVKLEVYYMLQSTRNPGDWVDANVLGTKLKLSF